jgi:hypothetical protein
LSEDDSRTFTGIEMRHLVSDDRFMDIDPLRKIGRHRRTSSGAAGSINSEITCCGTITVPYKRCSTSVEPMSVSSTEAVQ